MARTNKYTSLNFNDYYEKNNHNRSSSSSSSSSTTPSFNKTVLSNSRIHGNMLVLTRPSPKPIAPPPPRQPSPPPTQPPDGFSIESDSISLRPLGRTGSASPSPLLLNHLTANVSPKTNKFVPPHLRPGFHGREEKPETETEKKSGFGTQSSFRQVEEGRPKSGGGYEAMNRPRSSGSNRPYSSG